MERPVERCHKDLYEDAFARQKRLQDMQEHVEQSLATEERQRAQDVGRMMQEYRSLYKLKDTKTHLEREEELLQRKKNRLIEGEKRAIQRQLDQQGLSECTFRPSLNKKRDNGRVPATPRQGSPRGTAAAGSTLTEGAISQIPRLRHLLEHQSTAVAALQALTVEDARLRDTLRTLHADTHDRIQREETQRVVALLQGDGPENPVQRALVDRVRGMVESGNDPEIAQRQIVEELVSQSQDEVRRRVLEYFVPARLEAEGDLYNRRLTLVHELESIEAQVLSLRGGGLIQEAKEQGFKFGLAETMRRTLPSMPLPGASAVESTRSLGLGVEDGKCKAPVHGEAFDATFKQAAEAQRLFEEALSATPRSLTSNHPSDSVLTRQSSTVLPSGGPITHFAQNSRQSSRSALEPLALAPPQESSPRGGDAPTQRSAGIHPGTEPRSETLLGGGGSTGSTTPMAATASSSTKVPDVVPMLHIPSSVGATPVLGWRSSEPAVAARRSSELGGGGDDSGEGGGLAAVEGGAGGSATARRSSELGGGGDDSGEGGGLAVGKGGAGDAGAGVGLGQPERAASFCAAPPSSSGPQVATPQDLAVGAAASCAAAARAPTVRLDGGGGAWQAADEELLLAPPAGSTTAAAAVEPDAAAAAAAAAASAGPAAAEEEKPGAVSSSAVSVLQCERELQDSLFDKVDQNHDSVISREELARAVRLDIVHKAQADGDSFATLLPRAEPRQESIGPNAQVTATEERGPWVWPAASSNVAPSAVGASVAPVAAALVAPAASGIAPHVVPSTSVVLAQQLGRSPRAAPTPAPAPVAAAPRQAQGGSGSLPASSSVPLGGGVLLPTATMQHVKEASIASSRTPAAVLQQPAARRSYVHVSSSGAPLSRGSTPIGATVTAYVAGARDGTPPSLPQGSKPAAAAAAAPASLTSIPVVMPTTGVTRVTLMSPALPNRA